MNRFIFVFTYIFFLSLHLSATNSYTPPLKGDLLATSSFGEYRDGRFHMGVDFRAEIGTPVYAIDNGYVVRMRCGPWGYGRVLYIQFNSGIIGIYAHLSKFGEPYQSYLYKLQHQKKSFTIDEEIRENELPVQKGALIAYAGYSGTKFPHLHFELRKKDGITCINPWEYGFQWLDQNSPQISSILFVPGTTNTRINGRCLPIEFPINNQKQTPITIHAKGKLGLAINTIDPESGTCKLGPYRITLRTSNSILSVIEQNILDYNTYRDAKVVFYPYISNPIYWILWRWQGNQAPNYQHVRKDWLDIDSDEHLQIEVEDFYGRKATVPLYISEITSNTTNKTSPEPKTKSGVFVHYLPELITIEIVLPTNKIDTEPTILCLLDTEEQPITLKPFRCNDTVYELPWSPPHSGKWTFKVTHPLLPPWEKTIYAIKEQQPIKTIATQDLKISISPKSPYGTLWLSLSNASVSNLPKGMVLSSKIWKLEPVEVPIAEPIKIELNINDSITPKQRIHLYRKTGSSWTRVESKQNGEFVSASISNWGIYALFRDDTPPQIKDISITNGSKITSPKPPISCSISDIGSGIAKAEMFCDDHWLLAEYDGPRGTLRWEQDENLPNGSHQITIALTDYAGLTKKESITINVP